MKHFLLKFNHGVEIGARLAYMGHFKRTGDRKIYEIALEEASHQMALFETIRYYDEYPSKVIDGFFTAVGTTIGKLCCVCPIWSLNFIARSMEMFAVVNYGYLAVLYPEFEYTFRMFARAEHEHEKYFSR